MIALARVSDMFGFMKDLLIFTAIKIHNYDDVYIQLGWCNFFFVISKFRHTDTTISHVLLNVCVWTRPRKLGMIKAMRALILLVKAYVSVGKFQSPQTLFSICANPNRHSYRRSKSSRCGVAFIRSSWIPNNHKKKKEQKQSKAKPNETRLKSEIRMGNVHL